jgi:micrococcal nuclease
MYNYRAKVRRVVDGDTVDFEVDLGFNMYAKIRTRLTEVDTPERGERDFHRATAMLENLLSYQADEEGWITIKTEKTGKYGRWLVTIGGVNEVLAKIWPY